MYMYVRRYIGAMHVRTIMYVNAGHYGASTIELVTVRARWYHASLDHARAQ